MQRFFRLKAACYTTNLTMSVVANLSPLLFITFHDLYGVSYSLLGLLVLVNFVTQLGIDLIFSFFSHKFRISAVVKITPLIAVAGLALFAFAPWLFPGNVYIGLALGTVIFSASSGLAEVLISPVIAAIPAENPDREMSKLHSVYAWGVVGVILISTVFLSLLGRENWMFLPLLFALIPLVSFFLFSGARIPVLQTREKNSSGTSLCRKSGFWLCVFSIFFGGAAECTMSQWCSGFLEQAMGIPKVWGDVLGVALFGLMLAAGRSLYARVGSHVERILLAGFAGAAVCYGICALTDSVIAGLIAYAFTGLCTAMLWPGNLIVAAKWFPQGGVFLYAMMAAGGDLGGSVAPQLVGLVTDFALENEALLAFAESSGIAPEQLGLKLGMLLAALFPLCGMFLALRMVKSKSFCKKD